MGLWCVHQKPLTLLYKAHYLSSSSFISILITCAVVILPLVFAYMTNAFFKQTETYREQPEMEWTQDVYVELCHSSGCILASSVATFASAAGGDYRPATFKTSVEDLDHDGTADLMHLTAAVPIQTSESIVSAHLVAGVRLSAFDNVRLVLQGIVSVLGAGAAGSSMKSFGSIDLIQTSSLPFVGVYTDMDYSVVNTTSFRSVSDTTFDRFFEAEMARNETITVRNQKTVWKTQTRAAASVFTIEAAFKVPSLNLVYRPNYAEVLKFAWLQYLGMLVIVYTVANVLRYILFDCRILPTLIRMEEPQVVKKVLQ
eukprot:TRINITY_DN16778_c0_g1_i1.p1 TRINITY_DN16778_c0_g1~~TRINITY_DN16778_c0_g1_i1.p1  ORF type:complete len:313 (-),score=45.33 TRINITY_DN16778_c0_g1_i1:8-946(-)